MNIQLRIAGMTCGGCVKAVERALGALPGVTEVSVNLANGAAEVVAADGDPSALQAALLSALDDAGFSGVVA